MPNHSPLMTQTKYSQAEQPLCSPEQPITQRQNLSPPITPPPSQFVGCLFHVVKDANCKQDAVWELVHCEVRRAACWLSAVDSREWRTGSLWLKHAWRSLRASHKTPPCCFRNTPYINYWSGLTSIVCLLLTSAFFLMTFGWPTHALHQVSWFVLL